jgi:hypothetical protein
MKNAKGKRKKGEGVARAESIDRRDSGSGLFACLTKRLAVTMMLAL